MSKKHDPKKNRSTRLLTKLILVFVIIAMLIPILAALFTIIL